MRIKGMLLLLLVLTSACRVKQAEADGYNVGIILPLSGKASGVGSGVRNGTALALNALSEAERSKLHVVYEDDGSEPRNAVSAFQRLLADKKIDVVITAMSNSGNAVVPLSERAGVTLISLALTEVSLRTKPRRSLFGWIRTRWRKLLLPKQCAAVIAMSHW